MTPWYEGGNDDATLRMMLGTGKEVLELLPNDSAFFDELMTYLKIEKFLRLNTSSQLTKYETIKEAKRVEIRQWIKWLSVGCLGVCGAVKKIFTGRTGWK